MYKKPIYSIMISFSRFLLALLVFISTLKLEAQDNLSKVTLIEGKKVGKDINGGESDSYNNNDNNWILVGSDETGYYSCQMQPHNYYIQHFDKNLKVDVSTRIPDKYFHKSTSIIMLKGKLYLMCIVRDDKKLTAVLTSQKIDKQTLIPDSNIIVIARSKCSSKWDLEIKGVFSYVASDNDSCLFVLSWDTKTKKHEEYPYEQIFHLNVFNSNMDSVWKKDLPSPYPPDGFSIKQTKVDDNGTVYLVGTEDQDDTCKSMQKAYCKSTLKYHIFRYSNNGNSFDHTPIDLQEKFVTDFQIVTEANGDFICAGFYSLTGLQSEIYRLPARGVFYISVNGSTGVIKNQEYSEFDNEFVAQYYKYEEKKGTADLELHNFRIDKLLIHPTGNASLIAEYIYNIPTIEGNPGSRISGDILVFQFKTNGALAWKNKISIMQNNPIDLSKNFFYFFPFVIGDNLFFMYNDNKANFSIKSDDKLQETSPFSDNDVIISEFDKNGSFTKENLIPFGKNNFVFYPKLSRQTNDKEVIMILKNAEGYIYDKVIFQ